MTSDMNYYNENELCQVAVDKPPSLQMRYAEPKLGPGWQMVGEAAQNREVS